MTYFYSQCHINYVMSYQSASQLCNYDYYISNVYFNYSTGYSCTQHSSGQHTQEEMQYLLMTITSMTDSDYCMNAFATNQYCFDFIYVANLLVLCCNTISTSLLSITSYSYTFFLLGYFQLGLLYNLFDLMLLSVDYIYFLYRAIYALIV